MIMKATYTMSKKTILMLHRITMTYIEGF